MKFRIRIDFNDDNLNALETVIARQTLVEWFEKYTHKYVIVHHRLPHGNPHYHMYADVPMVMSEDAMRQRIKRQFKPQNRGDYSVKLCDDGREDEYISYMFNTKHGNIATHIADNVGADRIGKCLLAAQEVSNDFEQRKNSRKSKGPTIYDIAVEVNEVFSGQDTISNWTNTAIDVLHRHRKTCEPNMLIKIISTAKSLKDKGFLVRKVQYYFQEN